MSEIEECPWCEGDGVVPAGSEPPSPYRLSKEQREQLTEWSKHCDTDAGAIGGRITIAFTPTGLGMIVEAKCICGETLNLTDTDGW